MITLRTENPGMERGIGQRANAENDVRGFAVRIDIVVVSDPVHDSV